MSMTLEQALQSLEGSGLIRLAATHPELEYLFGHALVQEATYQTLLHADRKYLHRVVGDVLERAGARQAALAPLLAYHFDQAGETNRAQMYYRLAGDQAARVYANAEAVAHYSRALDILSAAGAPSSAVVSDLYTKRGRALELSGQYAQALANYEAMRAWARQHDERALELAALVQLAQVRSTPNEYFDAEQGSALVQEALQLAETLGDRQVQVKILWIQMNLCTFSGRMDDGMQYGERALLLARALGLREPLAHIATDLWRTYIPAGQLDRALELLDEAARLWRELGNVPMRADSLSTTAQVYYLSGQYAPALAVAHEALELSRSIHNDWGESYSLFWVGSIHWDQGEPARAIETMEACMRLGAEGGFSGPQFYTRADLARVYGSLGAVERGIALAQQAARLAEAHMPSFRAHPLARLASLYLLNGDVAEAEKTLAAARHDLTTAIPVVRPAVFQAAIEMALAQGNPAQALALADEFIGYSEPMHLRYVSADALHLKGEALLGAGRTEEAHAVYSEAYRVAASVGQRRLMWPVLMRLSAIALRQGQGNQADELRRQAREIVTDIAAHTPTEWRASFLALAAVRAALEE